MWPLLFIYFPRSMSTKVLYGTSLEQLLVSGTLKEEPYDAEEPMQKLKETIARSMPEQIAGFHESCRAYEETKTLK